VLVPPLIVSILPPAVSTLLAPLSLLVLAVLVLALLAATKVAKQFADSITAWKTNQRKGSRTYIRERQWNTHKLGCKWRYTTHTHTHTHTHTPSHSLSLTTVLHTGTHTGKGAQLLEFQGGDLPALLSQMLSSPGACPYAFLVSKERAPSHTPWGHLVPFLTFLPHHSLGTAIPGGARGHAHVHVL